MLPRILCFVFLGLVACFASAERPTLPSPPEGFQWQWCENSGVGMLQPKSWHFKSQSERGTDAYFITKESIEAEGRFRTGLSLNVINHVSRSGMPATEYALRFVSKAIQDRSLVLDIIPLRDIGHAKTCGYRIKTRGSVTHNFLIADDTRDMLFLFIFESPEAEWDQAWKFGERIMTNLSIDFPEGR